MPSQNAVLWKASLSLSLLPLGTVPFIIAVDCPATLCLSLSADIGQCSFEGCNSLEKTSPMTESGKTVVRGVPYSQVNRP